MTSFPILTVVEESQVSPPAATVGDSLLPLTFFDFQWLKEPPIHYLFFDHTPITQTQFMDNIIPTLKRSLSITLQHYFPFAGNLFVYYTCSQKPEIRYVEGDSVTVTFAECTLDFNELTGNHPRDCGMFYDFIPLLGEADKMPDFTKIPVFFVQVTLFPNHGISIGMTNHHSLGDASTRFNFIKAWTSIARFGNDEWFLSNGTLPFYGRVVENPTLDERFLKRANVENFKQEYQPQRLCRPTNKLRATFVLPRVVLNKFKNVVSTQVPTLAYVSSFTVACAYIWSCVANTHIKDELEQFGFAIDCRTRMNQVIPAAYFGNCLGGYAAVEKTTRLTGKEGFVTAAKLIGEGLHKRLADKDGAGKEMEALEALFSNGVPTTMIWVKPKKIETISIDYNHAVSINACKENDGGLEIGVSLPGKEMEYFVRVFGDGLGAYV